MYKLAIGYDPGGGSMEIPDIVKGKYYIITEMEKGSTFIQNSVTFCKILNNSSWYRFNRFLVLIDNLDANIINKPILKLTYDFTHT